MPLQFICTAVAVSISEAGSTPCQLRIDYRGRLTDASGIPVNGSFAMSFRVIDNGGASYPVGSPWAEAHDAVQVDNGFFRVVLGALAPFPDDLFASGPLDGPPPPLRFVEVTVAKRERSGTVALASGSSGSESPLGRKEATQKN